MSGRIEAGVPEPLVLAVAGSIGRLAPEAEARLFHRGRAADPEVERRVAAILAAVRGRGDAALRDLARRFDGTDLSDLEVPPADCVAALATLDGAVRSALEDAAAAIREFHRAQLPPPLEVEVRPGVRLGRRADPLRRVGVYAPGGRAAYPSSVLMGVVPARVAGVGEVLVCSPPGPDGRPPAAVLAACALAGADRVFALGGAGAIAAMALGTGSVPRVDKVVGPGNAYVNEAKRQLGGMVATDTPAGPSELLVVADDGADPERAAAELLAQAEHDPDTAVVLVATDEAIASRVRDALARRLAAEPRREIIRAALAASGAVLVAESTAAALDFAERYAPEHLLLLLRDPRAALDRVRAAGTVFLGGAASVAFGDYVTGANHVLPTGGLARAHSGLSTLDFLRWTTYQELSDDAAAALAAATVALAEAEGLTAHARAAALRAGPDGDRAAGTLGGPADLEVVAGTPGGPADLEGAADVPGTGRSDPPVRPGPGAAAPGASPLPFRPAYRDIALYDPERAPIEVDLSDNTNLFGASPAAVRALAALPATALTRYPPVFADRLKTVLARYLDVPPETVTTGCGSDDVIDSAIRAFCEPGHAVAYPDPTFSMVPLFVRMNAARPVPVPFAPDFALDADALLGARARVSYICQPNNPTGTLLDDAAIERVAAESDGIVLVDEAYAEFAGRSLAARAAGSRRVVVLRTLSKAHGLAGLRIGYAVGPPALIAEIEKSRGPYKITAAAEAAAVAVLTEDRAWVAQVVAQVTANRARLAAELGALGLRVWPSAANFLLVRAPEPRGREPADFAAALRERAVAVRRFASLPGAGDCIRVTIGPWPLMQRFLDAVREVL